MKGLLQKDWLYIKRSQRVYLTLILFYVVYGFLMPGGETMISVMIVMSSVLGMTLFTYDEQAKWDLYALSLPVTRKQIVSARYLVVLEIMLFFTAISVVLNLLVRLVRPSENSLDYGIGFLVGMTVVGLVLAAILLPMCFKWGVEKGRILLMAVIIAPSALVLLLVQSGIKPSDDVLEKMLLGFAIAAPILFFMSYLMSVKIYQKKDF